MSPERTVEFSSKLTDFLEELRDAGYQIGPPHHAAASDLLGA
jgi:hypothetical protein